MRISYCKYDLQLTRTWTIARGSASVIPVVMVVLEDNGNLLGLGEASPIGRYGETIETVQAFLRRVNPDRLRFDRVAESMNYLQELGCGNMAAKCALNVALNDGAARRTRKPVHDHIGLRFKEAGHLTSYSIGIDTSDVIREKVAAADEFPILKLKVGVPGDDLMVRALREVAPRKTIRVDANEGWLTKEEALRRIEWLAEDGNIQFVEQPMPASTSKDDLIWLKARSPLPLFADESYHTAADADGCAECFHGVNVKLAKAGGVTGAYEALQAACKRGLKTMIGCMIETSVLITAAAHLADLADYLDLDGNLLVRNDPFLGVSARAGILSFADAPEPFGLRVRAKA